MQAMTLKRRGAGALEPEVREAPVAGAGQLRVKVLACGVCRTDLHVVDGELPDVEVPRIPGHEIVGIVDQIGAGVHEFQEGDRVGVPWLGYTCGVCEYCRSGRENLCPSARFTGYHFDGGYAQYTVADARYAFRLPAGYADLQAAPLLCAGLIGFRAYRLAGPPESVRRLGLYGFGAAAHIIAQVARRQQEVYAFTSKGDDAAQTLARKLGAVWAGSSDQAPPAPLDAAIIFAPVGSLIPEALLHIVPGGTLVCAGIHMSDIPSFPYRLLWQERVVRSVANLTRQDAREFFELVARVPIDVSALPYELSDANRALGDLRAGRLTGAAVLVPPA